MRRFAPIVALVLLGLAPTPRARAEEPPAPPPAPAPTPAPTPAPAPKPRPAPWVPPVGIHWEEDFEAGMRRAVAEGRPVLLAVNALLDEGETGNRMLATQTYVSKAMGDASRPFVCFVGNPNDHATTKRPDGTEVCSRYGTGTCACHKAALAYVLKRFAFSGTDLISPSHYVLDPDGLPIYRGDYMQSCPTPRQLEELLAKASPTQALRLVWTAREAELAELSKTPVAELAEKAKLWLASKDVLAVAGLVSMIDQESDAARKEALLVALGGGPLPPHAGPLLEDLLRQVTSTQDATSFAEPTWQRMACLASQALDPGKRWTMWLWTRLLVRVPSDLTAEVEPRVHSFPFRTDSPAEDSPEGRAVWAMQLEALTLMGSPGALADLERLTEGLPKLRILRALRKAGRGRPLPFDTGTRDERRLALSLATPDEVKAGKAKVLAALEDPIEEIRVAAALALRLAGDGSGADILLAAISDPVEGPEVRAALAALAGGDRGADPGPWEDVVRVAASAGGGK